MVYYKNYKKGLKLNKGIAYNYKDILLQPTMSYLDSRSEADTTVEFGSRKFALPVCIANMKTVMDEDLAIWCAKNNYFYIMHRFGIDTVSFARKMKELNLFVSISLGINKDSYEVFDNLIAERIDVDYITIDIAHGMCDKMKKMLDYINLKKKQLNWFKPFVIAGNVCTPEGVELLESWGADSVKVGIGGGCFKKGSKVLTDKGLINIEDINIEDKVLTHTGKFKRVLGTSRRLEEDKLFIINDIYCTGNHELLVVNKEYKHLISEKTLKDWSIWISAAFLDNNFLLVDRSDGIKLVEITKKEFIDCNEQVYDLEVEDDHSYNINGIIVHNSVCTTKLKTGFSHPQFSAILECSKVAKKPIFGDGGIEHNGDIAKGLVAGATMIMAGGIFAGYDESPGKINVVMENGHEVKYKEYFGSASMHNKGESKHVEGRRILVPYRGPILDKFIEIKQDLQSSISYAGGNNLKAFNNVDWIVVYG
jgi:IMP dehydrogenase/GMP reductase